MCMAVLLIMGGIVMIKALQQFDCLGGCFGCLVWIVVMSVVMSLMGMAAL